MDEQDTVNSKCKNDAVSDWDDQAVIYQPIAEAATYL